MKKTLYNVTKFFLKPIAMLYFWINRWIIHNKFRYDMKVDSLGKPNLVSYPFIFLNKAVLNIYQLFLNEFNDYALSKYKNYINDHYAEHGVAYVHFNNLKLDQKKKYYFDSPCRIKYFYKNNNFLLNFKNGDSFLDIACGKGGNIRFLSEKFDKSKIRGFDINLSAIKIIKEGNQNPNVSVKQQSFLDFSFLNSINTESYDWVIVSHALSFIIDDNVETTIDLLRKLVNEFCRISKKGLLILDQVQMEKVKVIIEQNTRCSLRHDFSKLFSLENNGELYMMKSNDHESTAYFWKKLKINLK